MDPGSPQAECLSSTSSNSEDSPTRVAQIEMPFSRPQPDTSKVTLPTRPRSPKDGSGDGKMSSLASEFSDQRSNVGGNVSESSDKRSNADDNASEYSDQHSNADAKSRCSSTSEYEQESFETYQHKVAQLCRDIGYGEPSKIERMKGGGYNRIIGLEFTPREKSKYVLRIPRNGIEFDQSQDIKDQVATLNYVSKFLPVASVAAFDSTQNNAIASGYVLQERIAGTLMEDVFYDLPLAEKLKITTKVAELMMKMESIKLANPGRVVASDEVPNLQHQQMSSSKNVNILGFRAARFGSSTQFPELGEAPFTPLMRAILHHRKQLFVLKDKPWMVEKMEMLQKIVSQMEEVGLVRTKDKHCVMWHWDFAARNIMISRASMTPISPTITISPNSELPLESITAAASTERPEGELLSTGMQTTTLDPWVITGVLDWDGILSVPLILARQPPLWLWCDEKDRSSAWSGNFDVPPARELTQDELLIKAHFDQIMARANPSFIEDAYHRGPWLRRLARFALFGFSEYGCFERYDAFVTEWEEHLSTIAGNRHESFDKHVSPVPEEVEGL
jgi:hypothetical protein